ncbi:hypothetical protein EVAR_85366_1 [Eumeta japonica]|uniref:Uncharacterized protein n=1 Tax=Eumeta variegata TaxID=151549 RepID=A0A4C1WSW3_EUMVA|nr:hypothetical protein EVAR_85366_1 [Eumeta japonica]
MRSGARAPVDDPCGQGFLSQQQNNIVAYGSELVIIDRRARRGRARAVSPGDIPHVYATKARVGRAVLQKLRLRRGAADPRRGKRHSQETNGMLVL